MITIPEQATDEQRRTIEALLCITGNPPNLEQSWAILDFVWDALGCDNTHPDWDRIGGFYEHPVWLLIGLFIEQHEESLQNREAFVQSVAELSPKRLADFGGGFVPQIADEGTARNVGVPIGSLGFSGRYGNWNSLETREFDHQHLKAYFKVRF